MQSCRTSSWLLQIPFAPKGGHIGPRLHVARGKIRVREIVFLLFAALCLTTLIIIPGSAGKATAVVSPAEATGIAAAGAPVLLTQANSTRGIALDSVTELAEPFQPQTPVAFGSDRRTRVMLFATNLTLATGENASAVTADAEDVTSLRYPLIVEYVGAVPGQTWMSAVVVRLNDNLGDVGDVLWELPIRG